MAKAQPEAVIREYDESTPIIVTPDSPLVINETPVSYDEVQIAGGAIYSNVETKVSFKILTKTS